MIELNLPARVYIEEGVKIETAYIEACDWLKSLGLFSASNRFSIYLKIISDFKQEGPDSFQSNDSFFKYIIALAEATDLIRIYHWMNTIDSNTYLEQLKKVTSGRPFKSQIGADPARDFAFELSMAARFLAAGHTVDVTSIADTIAYIDRRKIYIECKRVQSPSKVMKRIAEACDQLGNRLRADPSSKSRGLVACKITDVLNPNAQIAIFPEALDFRHASQASLNIYIRDNESEIKRRIRSKQLGIMFENNLQGIVYDKRDPNSEPAFINCRGASLFHYGLGEEDASLITSMAPNLSNQNIF